MILPRRSAVWVPPSPGDGAPVTPGSPADFGRLIADYRDWLDSNRRCRMEEQRSTSLQEKAKVFGSF
jgi:hypothetical protein